MWILISSPTTATYLNLHNGGESHFVAGFVKSYGDGDGNEAENLTDFEDFDQQPHYGLLLACTTGEKCNFVAGL